MSTNDIIITRDEDNDVLYVIKQAFQKKQTVNLIIAPSVTVRLDHTTRKVVGFTIEEFSKTFPDLADVQPYPLMERFDSIIDFLNALNLIPSTT